MSCKSCKKKKPLTSLPPLEEMEYIPTVDEIKSAFIEMSNVKGLSKDKYEQVNRVYRALFNEDLRFGCNGCGQQQWRKFNYHIKEVLKIQI